MNDYPPEDQYGYEASVEEAPSRKKKKEDDNVVKTSFFETKDYILEQIKVADGAEVAERGTGEEGTAFAKYSKLTDDVEIVNEFEYKNKVYRPIADDTLRMGGVSLPTGVKEYKDTAEIVDQSLTYMKAGTELPVFYEKFFPHLILFYWVYEKFPFIPYVQFVGRTATGKTTAMEVFGSLCYKPIDTTGSLTIASIFRIATQWKGTLLIDEFENSGESSKDIISFLKAGVSDRLVLRTEGEVRKEVKAYIVKAPKIFTSEVPINDAGLQSRTIVVKMEKNKREIPLYRLKEDYDEANDIRNKLLLWRFRNLNKVNLRSIKFGFDELKGFDRRVQQIVTPIYHLADEKTRKELVTFAGQQQEETQRERRESFHGAIFMALCAVWDTGNEAEIKTITSTFNEDSKAQGYKNEVTEKKISNEIRKILGFDTEKRGHSKLAYVVKNEEKEKELRLYYGIQPSVLSTASTASSAEESNIVNNNFNNNTLEDAIDIFGI